MGRSLGSPALEAAADLLLAQQLHRGTTPGDPHWRIAFDAANHALQLTTEPLGKIECLLVLANLQLRAFRPEETDRLLEEAERLIPQTGNRIAIAGVEKLRSRSFAVRANRSTGMARARWAGRALYWSLRSSARFRRIGMHHTAALSEVEQAALRAVRIGRQPDLASLSELVLDGEIDHMDRSRRTVTWARALLDAGATDEALRVLGEPSDFAATNLDRELAIGFWLTRARALAPSDGASATKSLRTALGLLTVLDRSIEGGAQRAVMTDISDPVTKEALDLAIEITDGASAITLMEWRRTGRLAALIQGVAVPTTHPARPLVEALSSATARRDQGERVEILRQLGESTSALLLDVFDDEPLDCAGALESVSKDAAVVMYDDEGDSIRVVWHDRQSGAEGAVSIPVTDRMAQLLELLGSGDTARDHIRIQLRCGDLEELGQLVPIPVADALAAANDTRQLLMIPSGRLWSVPWNAVPVRHGALTKPMVCVACVSVFPSLRLHALVVKRSRGRHPSPERSPQRVLAWVAPGLDEHDQLTALWDNNCTVRRPPPLPSSAASSSRPLNSTWSPSQPTATAR